MKHAPCFGLRCLPIDSSGTSVGTSSRRPNLSVRRVPRTTTSLPRSRPRCQPSTIRAQLVSDSETNCAQVIVGTNRAQNEGGERGSRRPIQ